MITILLVVAFVLFLLAAFGVKSPINLGWAGLAVYLLSHLVGAMGMR